MSIIGKICSALDIKALGSKTGNQWKQSAQFEDHLSDDEHNLKTTYLMISTIRKPLICSDNNLSHNHNQHNLI